MKIVTIVGARPQFIKSAALSREINLDSRITEVIINTGQHYDQNLSNIFFEELNIPKPVYSLNIGGGTHAENTGKMMIEIEKILLQEKNIDYVLVYGDTDSTLAGALAAKKINKPVAHVEAGLRSYNMQMPEEINRVLTDHISSKLFVPSENAISNLHKEGISQNIFNVGDIMKDSYQLFANKIKELKYQDSNFVLATIHRAENTNNKEKLQNIFSALDELAETIKVILPVHPRTRNYLEIHKIKPKKINFIEPQGFLEMLSLLKNCSYVITDSGGVQKEAYFSKKFCLTLRDQTEWTELIENGVNFLCSTDKDEILKFTNQISNLSSKGYPDINLFGDGTTAKEIISNLIER